MSDSLRIALAQLNFLVGDVQGNAARVIATARRHSRGRQPAQETTVSAFGKLVSTSREFSPTTTRSSIRIPNLPGR